MCGHGNRQWNKKSTGHKHMCNKVKQKNTISFHLLFIFRWVCLYIISLSVLVYIKFCANPSLLLLSIMLLELLYRFESPVPSARALYKKLLKANFDSYLCERWSSDITEGAFELLYTTKLMMFCYGFETELWRIRGQFRIHFHTI